MALPESQLQADKISLCMIVKDETDTLKACLESIYKYVDEIVVAWNGTNGETKKILNHYKCKVHPYEWIDDFAHARNFSFAQAKNEICMWLDADDVVIGAEKLQEVSKKAFADPRIGSIWLPYNYDQNEYGECVMLLYRERIVRKSWWAWKRRIHEVMLPVRDCGHLKLEMGDPDCIQIKHTVVPERVIASAARNLNITQKAYWAEKEEGNLDPVTAYDYARSLKASGNPKEALEVFKEFIEVSGFDDDRYEAWRSVADIHRKFRWFESALLSEMEAVKLRPRRPEAYFGLAETYFCLEDWDNVIWYTNIGYRCPPREDNMPSDPIAIKAKPLLPLHFAMYQKGNFREALVTCKKALEFFPKNKFLQDSHATYVDMIEKEELEQATMRVYNHLNKNGERSKLKHLAKAIPDFVKDHPVFVRLANCYREEEPWKNRVIIYCGSSFEFWDPTSAAGGIGGSEEAVINLAPLLARLGWQVEVYNNCLHEANYDGVLWRPFYQYDQNRKAAIFVVWRDSRSVLLAPAEAKVFAWLHDRQKKEYWPDEYIQKVDKFFFLSNYHRQDLPTVPDEKVFITSNGIQAAQFIGQEARDPKRCVYASSPDRGLDILLQNWPKVMEKHPEAELHVFYGFSKTYSELHKNNQNMLDFRDRILKMLEQPGVVYHGRVGHEELAREFLKSSLWLYPTYFTEISCITAMKVQAAGAIPVTMALAALNETVQYGYKVSFDIHDSRTQIAFVNIVNELLGNQEKQEKIRTAMTKWARTQFDWKQVANQWDGLFKQTCQTPALSSKPS